MIVGLIPQDRGQILIGDKDITRYPMHGRARAGIGYLPQEASVFRRLTVAQNLMAILETRRDLNRSQRHEKMEALLKEFHITHIRDNLGMSLSGASDAGPRSRERWPWNPRSSCWMNPLQVSTRSR